MSDAAGRSAVTQAFGFEFGTVAILASLASAMLIPGCTWFSPDAARNHRIRRPGSMWDG
jgi:hypothetical protein